MTSASSVPLTQTSSFMEQVYDQLVAEIADGRLQPLQKISQEEIAQRFNVSRQPVSHAIQILKREGLVCDTGRKGIEIAAIDVNHIKSLYQVRMALEYLSARLAAERIAQNTADPALIAAAKTALSNGQTLVNRGEAIDQKSRADLIRADVEFHTSIYRLAGNPCIENVVLPQWVHFQRAMMKVLDTWSAQRRAWTGHATILDAILSGDPDIAQEAIRQHDIDTTAALDGKLDELN